MTSSAVALKATTYPNPSGLRPLGRAVLLEPYDPETKKSILIIPESAKEGRQMREIRGIVLAVGPECWVDAREARARPGDKVMVSRFCGVILTGPADGRTYRMVNDEDIYCAIDKEAQNG